LRRAGVVDGLLSGAVGHQAKSKSGMFTGLVEVMRNWQRDWFELVELPNGPSQ